MWQCTLLATKTNVIFTTHMFPTILHRSCPADPDYALIDEKKIRTINIINELIKWKSSMCCMTLFTARLSWTYKIMRELGCSWTDVCCLCCFFTRVKKISRLSSHMRKRKQVKKGIYIWSRESKGTGGLRWWGRQNEKENCSKRKRKQRTTCKSRSDFNIW